MDWVSAYRRTLNPPGNQSALTPQLQELKLFNPAASASTTSQTASAPPMATPQQSGKGKVKAVATQHDIINPQVTIKQKETSDSSPEEQQNETEGDWDLVEHPIDEKWALTVVHGKGEGDGEEEDAVHVSSSDLFVLPGSGVRDRVDQ